MRRLELQSGFVQSVTIEIRKYMDDDQKATVMLRLPSTLSAYSGGKSQLPLKADTIEQLLSELEFQYPLDWQRICNAHRHVRARIKIFVKNELIMGIDRLKTLHKPGHAVIVLPATVAA